MFGAAPLTLMAFPVASKTNATKFKLATLAILEGIVTVKFLVT